MDLIYDVDTQLNSNFEGVENLKFLLLISGGIDSVVLLDLLIKSKSVKTKNLYLLHCNYGIHKSCNEAQELCKMLAEKNKLKIYFYNPKLKNNNFEHRARSYRYKVSSRLIDRKSIDFILTAHHLDDHLETLIMQQKNNADSNSNLGIHQKNVNIFRPIFNISKKNINFYAEKNNISWIEDTTNNNLKILRNRIRHKEIPFLMKSNPNILEKILAENKSNLECYKFLKREILMSQSLIVEKSTKNYFIVNLSKKNIPKENLKLYFQIYSKIILKFDLRASKKHWLSFINFINRSESGKKFDFDKKIIVINDKKKFIFIKASYIKKNKCMLLKDKLNWFDTKVFFGIIPNKNNIKYKVVMDKEIFNKGIFIRNWKNGDKCFSEYYQSYVKLSNIFINNKITNIEKIEYPILVDSKDEIVSVPNLYNKYHCSTIDSSNSQCVYWVNE